MDPETLPRWHHPQPGFGIRRPAADCLRQLRIAQAGPARSVAALPPSGDFFDSFVFSRVRPDYALAQLGLGVSTLTALEARQGIARAEWAGIPHHAPKSLLHRS